MDHNKKSSVTNVKKKNTSRSIGFNLNEHWSKYTVPLSTFAIPTFKDEKKTKGELNETFKLIHRLNNPHTFYIHFIYNYI